MHNVARQKQGKSLAEKREFKRFFQGKVLDKKHISQIQSLDEFNRLLADYICRHNTTKHSVTGQTPLERYLASNERIRKPVSKEWLEEAFHNRVIRNVNKDTTIHLSNASYDAPMQFIGQKVEVRFIPGDPESAYILYGGQH